MELFLKCLQDPEPEIRATGAAGLAQMGQEALSAAPALRAATRDPHPAVRSEAIWALERIGAIERRRECPLSVVYHPRGGVIGAGFTVDGSGIVTVSSDRRVERWDGKSKFLDEFEAIGWLQRLTRREKSVRSVAWHPDGEHVLLGFEDHAVRLWSLDSKRAVQSLTFRGKLGDLTVCQTERCGLAGFADGTVAIWDTNSGKVFQALRPERRYQDYGRGQTYTVSARIESLTVSPDHRYVAAGAADTIRLWDIATGRELRHFASRSGSGSSCVRFSPDGKYLLSGSTDHYIYTARLWDVQSGEQAAIFVGHHDHVREVAISPDGLYVLTASNDHTARLWTIDMSLIHVFETFESCANCVAFSRDGKRVLVGSDKVLVGDVLQQAHRQKPESPSVQGGRIRVHCPKCEKSLAPPERLAGKRVRCPTCKTEILIPNM